MPNQDAAPAPDPGRRMSRRSLLQGAATAGAAGLAATAMGAAVSQAAASRRPDLARGSGPGQSAAGPIMVHVRDARSGDIELFAGTSQTRVHDKDLAARITRALNGRSN